MLGNVAKKRLGIAWQGVRKEIAYTAPVSAVATLGTRDRVSPAACGGNRRKGIKFRLGARMRYDNASTARDLS
jgi:hypothetical protein